MSSRPLLNPAGFRVPRGDVELLSLESGAPNTLRCSLRVPPGARFLAGHFDGEPIVPAVAELSAMVLPAIASHWPDSGPLRALRGLRFERPIRPDEEIELTVERRGPTVYRFTLKREGARCAVGQLELEADAEYGGAAR